MEDHVAVGIVLHLEDQYQAILVDASEDMWGGGGNTGIDSDLHLAICPILHLNQHQQAIEELARADNDEQMLILPMQHCQGLPPSMEHHLLCMLEHEKHICK